MPGSELRLIDFGSGTLDDNKKRTQPSSSVTPSDLIRHTTFAGSAFYQSPEMFQRDYDARTDVWSVGVALYVLVAGYPADCLQKAFNVLQSSKRNLRTDLPHLPSNMPDSFYDLLSLLLVYRDKKRVTAGDVLSHEFVKFHKDIQEQQQSNVLSINDISALAAAATELQEQSVSASARGNVSLKGSVYRHTYFLGFKKFERSLTTLLAAMLSTTELDRLFDILNEHAAAKNTQRQQQQAETAINENTLVGTEATTTKIDDTASTSSKLTTATDNNNKREHEQILSVCKVAELKDIIKNDLKNDAM